MSNGGVFQLITNEGKQDFILMATALLNQNLLDIRQRRQMSGMVQDPTPQLTDIERTHILFMNAHFKPFAAIGYEYNRVPKTSVQLDTEVEFSIPQYGDFFNDMVVHVQMKGLAAVNQEDQGDGVTDQVRYADKLGVRLFEQVKFEVNGNPLDSYTSEFGNYHDIFLVQPNKRRAWNNCIGQENPKKGYLTQNLGVDPYRELKQFVDGPQTPKVEHELVDMWIPLLFWFNEDVRLAIPSVAIPYGQRFIRIKLAAANRIAAGIDNGGGGAFVQPDVTRMDLYINNIFVNPEIHDIFIKRIGFSLIRVHRQQVGTYAVSKQSVQMTNFKWPVETIYLGLRPQENSNPNIDPLATMDNWHRLHQVELTEVPYPVAVPGPGGLDQLAFTNAFYFNCNKTIDTIQVRAHGVDLYIELDSEFFNWYVPYTFGGHDINSPDDCGALMINFCLYPRTYQPSGHVNISRAREFYIDWTSSVVSQENQADMISVAIAINFLLISDGSAVLRYST